MSESVPHAIFLSYAREDSAAAERIAEALRSHGVEVWFDQNELRGGDAWDQKIKKQIRDCALFLPVISAHTQERGEGYFRREWKLAVERTHDMAEGVPFLVPVVIDDTSESGASVPEQFMHVQWTRLSGALPTLQFVEQVKRLLVAPRRPVEVARAFQPVDHDDTGSKARATPEVGRRVPAAAWMVAVTVALLVAAGLIWRQQTKPAPTSAPNAGAGTRPPTAEKPAPVVNDKSIAVLPFTNLSDDKDSRVFADGVHEDILTDLALIRDLHVVSRTSVEQYRDTKKPIRQIGTELNVAYLLEGSVRRAGNTVRVTGQLIRAATDEHVWAKKFDRELKDVFAIQTEIATEIAAALHSVLSPQEKQLIAAAPTASLDAYDLFVQARDIRNRMGDTSPALVEQIRLFERAIAIDPQFGKAWAKLAWARSFLFSLNYERTDARLAEAKKALGRAERLIPDTPELFLSRGYFSFYTALDFPRALEDFRKAVELAPNFAEIRMAIALIYRRQGQWQKAIDTYAEAERMDPANPLYPSNVFGLMLAGRRYAEAEAAQRRALKLGRDEESGKRWLVVLAFLARGEMPGNDSLQALTPAYQRLFARLASMDLPTVEATASAPTNPGIDLAHRAFLLAAQGNLTEARLILEKPVETLRQRIQEEPANAGAWSRLAVMEALLGRRDEALRCARKAMELVPESKDPWIGPRYRVTYAKELQCTTTDCADGHGEMPAGRKLSVLIRAIRG